MSGWVLKSSRLLVDSAWLRVFQNAYNLPGGQVIDDYYIIERQPFVLVVAGDDENVILVRQYRPATDRVYYSLPAGYIGANETPEAAAARELCEETGLTADKFTPLGELHPLPGYVRSPAYVIRCSGLQGELRVQDTQEVLKAVQFSWRDAISLIQKNEINEMQAVSGLLLAYISKPGATVCP